jgi:hypothetical protein
MVGINANEAMGLPWWDLAVSAFDERVKSGGGVFCCCVCQESGFSRREDIFLFNLVHNQIV